MAELLLMYVPVTCGRGALCVRVILGSKTDNFHEQTSYGRNAKLTVTNNIHILYKDMLIVRLPPPHQRTSKLSLYFPSYVRGGGTSLYREVSSSATESF